MIIGARKFPAARARRRIAALYTAHADPEQAAMDWAAQALSAAAQDPVHRPLRSVRALRRADRRLDVAAARYLVDRLGGRDPGAGERINPLLN